MGAFLSWDRDDHFAADHGISGISRKTVQYCDGQLDIGFASYPAGELLCRFLNYDAAAFFALKRKRDGRLPVSAEEVAALLRGLPYYADLMAQLPEERYSSCGQLFSQYQRGSLWQDTEVCLREIEKRYSVFANLLSESGQALPANALSFREPIPAAQYVLVEGKLAEQYRVTQLSELLYLDFVHLLLSGGQLRKCANCGGYFLPERGYEYRYCPRIAPGEQERTCREIGAIRTRREKLDASAALAEYQRAYKRYYAWMLKQRWTKDQFQAWQREALVLREQALQREIPDLTDQLSAIAQRINAGKTE